MATDLLDSPSRNVSQFSALSMWPRRLSNILGRTCTLVHSVTLSPDAQPWVHGGKVRVNRSRITSPTPPALLVCRKRCDNLRSD